MSTKICTRCNIDTPLSDFYYLKSVGKYYAYCKKCSKDVNKKSYEKNKDRLEVYWESRREETRERQRVHYRENRETYLKRNKKNYKENQEYYRDYRKQSYIEHLEERKAVRALNYAIKKGDIEPPTTCESCLKTPEKMSNRRSIEGHHEDYSHPFIVVWLCRSCHKRHHSGNSPEISQKVHDLFKKKLKEES